MRGGAQILDLPLDILEKLFEKNVIKAGLVRDIDVGKRNERDLNLDGLMLFEEHNESVLACQFRDDECCILRTNISCHKFMGNLSEQYFLVKLVLENVSTRYWCERVEG